MKGRRIWGSILDAELNNVGVSRLKLEMPSASAFLFAKWEVKTAPPHSWL